MARLLSFLLMLTLMVSHGSLGAAVGHHEQGGHSHTVSIDDHGHDGHESEASEDDSADVDFDKGSKSSAGHVHLSADGLPGAAFAEPVLLVTGVLTFPHIEAALRSAAVPPLLEPPSA